MMTEVSEVQILFRRPNVRMLILSEQALKGYSQKVFQRNTLVRALGLWLLIVTTYTELGLM